jgi:protein-S-isoprenylcysteine O-methyltransferase Ste14
MISVNLELKIIIFILISCGLGWLSRRSLRSHRAHGFYRFFAWETAIILILLNIEYWFVRPFSINQIISWILLLLSIIAVTAGTISLRKRGKPGDKRNDSKLIGIEKTTGLVTSGAYRYIRHPMYSSFILGAWGICFKNIDWVNIAVSGITTLLAFLTALKEEKENIKFFGVVYVDYMKSTKRFFPFLL